MGRTLLVATNPTQRQKRRPHTMILEGIQEISRLVRQGEPRDLTQVIESTFDGLPAHYEYLVKAGANGRELSTPITPFRPTKLEVTTLTGLVDAVKAGCAGKLEGKVAHVESYLKVALRTAYADTYGVRDTLVTATHTPIDAFVFDQYYTDPQKFIIALQVAFYQTDEILYLIRLASNLKAGNTVQTEDDGFSQTVTLRAGEVSTAEVKLQPRIKLLPIRTFPEAAPVQGEFLIRLKQTPDQTPGIALFNVDGSKWQAETMRSIRDYLVKHLPQTIPVLA
jgi:hypothetical protein